ncbi:MAG TPA: hypothetical protein VFK79_14125 [Xanthobacteraceae bacterium]|nr:hypothetical protein [Xanthobacteraceae bacterium]
MKGIRETGLRALLAAVACIVLAKGTAAETKLTDFNGEWSGTGQDRDSPLQSLQDTSCRNAVRATAQRMRIEMTCERKSGVRKTVRMNVTLQGDQLTGRINRRISQPGKEDSVIGGMLSGTKSDSSANLTVSWKGPTPSTSINLKLETPTSYSMKVTALGLTFMDATFNRISERAPRRR